MSEDMVERGRVREACADLLAAFEGVAFDVLGLEDEECQAACLCGEPICEATGCIMDRIAIARAALTPSPAAPVSGDAD